MPRSRSAKGDLTPGVFTTSLLRLGIAPAGGADGTTAAAAAAVRAPTAASAAAGNPPPPPQHQRAAAAEAAAITAPVSAPDIKPVVVVGSAASSSSAVPAATGTTRRTLECTDGAMEALRLCHEQFVALVASELAVASSASGASSTSAGTGGGRKKKKGERKRARSQLQQSNGGSAGETTTSREGDGRDGVASDEEEDEEEERPSRIINDKDVMACLDRLGMGHIGAAAMRNVKLWEELAVESPSEQQNKKPTGVSASKSSMMAKRAGKRVKKGFRKKDVTAELVAEQERLLAESARAVRERMARQGGTTGGGDV